MPTLLLICGLVLAVMAITLLTPAPKGVAQAASRWTARPRRWVGKRFRERHGLVLAYAGLLGAAAVVGVLALIIWVLPSVLTEHPHIPSSADRQKAITDTRTGLVAVLAAIGAAGGLAYTARTYRLSREGQVTDRYSKAVEQLGNDLIEVRLGGIYALERLMRTSPKDQPTIMETLAAFVRQRAPVDRARALDLPEHTDVDVQAVLTVLTRRKLVKNEKPIDLRRCHLRRAWLEGACLRSAVFEGANLTGARLSRANLTDARLRGANLTDADLARAVVLRGALLDEQLVSARNTDQIVWTERGGGAASPTGSG